MIKNFEFYGMFYSADDLGNVYGKSGMLKQRLNEDGYPCVSLGSKGNGRRSMRVHRIIADLFIPLREGRSEVNHIDGNKQNNCVSNLEWVNHSEQMLHAHRTGLKDQSGVKNGRHILTPDKVLEIRRLYSSGEIPNIAELARMYGIGWQTANHVIKRTTWAKI